jgi:hypothetical protein
MPGSSLNYLGRQFYNMKLICIGLLFLWYIPAAAQPVLIAEDKNPNKTTDGYKQGFLVDAPKGIGGSFYFSTPNFRLYQTDGTPDGTKMLVQFPAESLVYVKAVTKKFVYFTMLSGGKHSLRRLDRQTLKQESLTHQQKPLTLDMGYSAVFTSPSKDLIAIRMYNLEAGVTQLIAFPDDGPVDAKWVTASLRSDNSALLNNFSDVAFLGPQIFYHGFEKKQLDGQSVFEYIIQSSAPATTGKEQEYTTTNVYSVRAQGYELNDKFYTINDSLFTLGFLRNKQTGARDLFIGSIHRQTLRVPAILPTDQNFVWGEVLDNQLYLVNGNRLLSWVPGSGTIKEVFRKRTYQYQSMQPDRSLLKCGNYLVLREEDSLRTFNLQNNRFEHVGMPENFTPPNSLYNRKDHIAWTDRNFIYYIRYNGLIPSLIQYDPVSRQHTPVIFPEYKNEQFTSFQAIFQLENKLLFLTKYTGKKDQPVYRIFVL